MIQYRYLMNKNGKVFDLKSPQVSSVVYLDEKTAKSDEWGLDEATYMVYYYSEAIGEFLEYDNKGGHSMDGIDESDILKHSDTLTGLADHWILVKDGEKPLIKDVFSKEYCKEKYFDEGYKCYLASYNLPKGLMVFAALNSDGELQIQQ